MSHYLLEYRYADQEKRARARDEHLAYMNALHAEGRVLLAGPLSDESGAVVVLRAANEAEAAQLVRDDPYTHAGVTTDLQLREWRVVVPGP